MIKHNEEKDSTQMMTKKWSHMHVGKDFRSSQNDYLNSNIDDSSNQMN